MSRFELPDGVPPDNSHRAAFSGKRTDEGDYAAPDMATPRFARPGASTSERVEDRLRQTMDVIIIDTDDDDDKPDQKPSKPAPKKDKNRKRMIYIAIGAALAFILLVVVAVALGQPPLCADQADWNQYNCRKG